MSFYRLFFLDQSSHIKGVKEFETVDDETAILVAMRLAEGCPFEVWNYDRLVTREDIVNTC